MKATHKERAFDGNTIAQKNYDRYRKIPEQRAIRLCIAKQQMASLGIRGEDCVVLFSYKGPTDSKEVQTYMNQISKNLACTAVGLPIDCKALFQKANHLNHKYNVLQKIDIQGAELVRKLSHDNSLRCISLEVRTLAAELLVADYNIRYDEFKLYFTDTFGNVKEYTALAVGQKKGLLQKYLRTNIKTVKLSMDECLSIGYEAMKESFPNKLNDETLEIGVLTETGFQKFDREKVNDLIECAEQEEESTEEESEESD